MKNLIILIQAVVIILLLFNQFGGCGKQTISDFSEYKSNCAEFSEFNKIQIIENFTEEDFSNVPNNLKEEYFMSHFAPTQGANFKPFAVDSEVITNSDGLILVNNFSKNNKIPKSVFFPYKHIMRQLLIPLADLYVLKSRVKTTRQQELMKLGLRVYFAEKEKSDTTTLVLRATRNNTDNTENYYFHEDISEKEFSKSSVDKIKSKHKLKKFGASMDFGDVCPSRCEKDNPDGIFYENGVKGLIHDEAL